MAAALVAACTAGVTGLLPRVPVSAARADEVTASQDNLRTGWDPNEPGLSPATVAGPGFGEIFVTHLYGQIYGQPVVAGKTVVIVTETNHVYGLSALTGRVEWSHYLGPAQPWTAIGCKDLAPDIGITSTPVYDPVTGTVYAVAVVANGPTPAQPHVYAYAFDAQTGVVRPGWPVTIQGSPVNDPSASFNPFTERQRAGLLLLGGSLYAGFASYCDFQPYAGYVAGISTASRAVTLWTDEAGLTNNMAGIWQGGGGLMSDGPGRIFLSTGNGVSPPAGPGARPPGQLGDSVVRLNVARNGMLSTADFFSPANAPTLDFEDQDLGSGGPVGLPFGTSAYPHLLVQAGKDGRLFVLNRDALGGREMGAGGTDDYLSVGQYAPEYGHPAAFGPQPTVSGATSGDYVYYAGVSDSIRYLQFGVSPSGVPVLTDVASTSDTYGFSSGSPVVTSNGSTGAVLWDISAPGVTGVGAMLQAYDAVPASTCTASQPCTEAPIWSAPIGTASEFSIAATDSGRVYVGTRDGNVYCFGSPDAAPLQGKPANLGSVGIGRARTVTVTMTAAAAVTVTGVSVAGAGGTSPFRLGAVTVDGGPAHFPASLSPGGTLTAAVSFAPSHAGGATAELQADTTTPNFPAVTLSLTGLGMAYGLQSSAAVMAFGRVTDLTATTKNVIISNDSPTAERVIATTGPGAPFRAWLPVTGRMLAAGQSIAVPVRYRPARPGISAGSFSITTQGRHVLTVRLTGTGVKAVSLFTAAHSDIGFGAVSVGSRATRTIVLTNRGNLPVVVTGTAGPAEPFATQQNSPAGLPVNPGYDVAIPVTFTPASGGAVAGRYVVRWHDAAGSHVLSFGLNGRGVRPRTGYQEVPPPGGGWQFNGSAAMRGQWLVLTAGGGHAAGSAVYPMPQGSQVTARFAVTLGGDGGMTFAVLSANQASAGDIGRSGGQFGFGGLPGVAVTLASARFPGDPSGNFAGIGTGVHGRGIRYLATTSRIPDLRRGSHVITVTIGGSRVSVSIGSRQVLSAQLPAGAVPASALLAFTGSTGSTWGAQEVRGIGIRTAGGTVPAPGGGWSFNGSAAASGPLTVLTPAMMNLAGSVVYPVPVRTSGLKVSFTAELHGGSGANGMAFALLAPATSRATSVGDDGTGMGFGRLGVVAVALDTVRLTQYGSSNAVAICVSTRGRPGVGIVQRAEAIPQLRVGPVSITAQVSQHGAGYVITVWLDGVLILQHAAPSLGSTALLAFTGATGTGTDVHAVRDVAITAAG